MPIINIPLTLDNMHVDDARDTDLAVDSEGQLKAVLAQFGTVGTITDAD